MPISDSAQLFSLISSLDRSDKRSFRLFVSRIESNKNNQFVQLFDLLDKMKTYSDARVKKEFPTLSNNNLSNLRRHLYAQILKSLRLVNSKKDIELLLREYLDYAKILYSKGLYLQSLKILDKAKDQAKNASQNILLFEILEYQKMIESRHITRSRKVKNKVENLISQSDKTKDVVASTSQFANLSLRMQGLYIKFGYAKNEKDLFLVKDYFQSQLPNHDVNRLSFYESVLLHQSYVWFYNMQLEFKLSYKHAYLWVRKFEEKPLMIEKDPDLYVRGLHYLLTHTFYLNDEKRFRIHYKKLLVFQNQSNQQLIDNTKIMYTNYRTNAEINLNYLTGNFTEGINNVAYYKESMSQFTNKLDSHRTVVFMYKIAWLYFGAGRYNEALDYTSSILNTKQNHLRNDIISYSRLLELICHFHLEHYDLIYNTHVNVKRSFSINDEKNKTVDLTIDFIRKMSKEKRKPIAREISELSEEINNLLQQKLSKRPFLYFNFLLWIESLQYNKCIEDIFHTVS